jgi:hemoglobin/transferrin/lactoferrin receptor protein
LDQQIIPSWIEFRPCLNLFALAVDHTDALTVRWFAGVDIIADNTSKEGDVQYSSITWQHRRGAQAMGTLVLLAALGVDPIKAADMELPTIPAMVVTATRDERLTHDTPYATSVLASDVLRIEKAARTLPEALKYEPGTLVQKTAHGQGSPYIRGFTSQRTLLMIDGVRLNNSVFREGPNQYWNTIDTLGLHQLELVRGPFSALYGSDAIGGAVNAITRGARDIRPGHDWDRRLYYRYGSAEQAHVARAESIGRLTDALTLTLGYTWKDFGDVKGGRQVGAQPKTGYGERDWDAKMEYFLSDNSYLVLAHQRVDIDNAWRTHQTIYGIDWQGLSVGSDLRRVLDQERDLTYLQYHHYDGSGIAEEIHAGFSHHLQAEQRDRLRTRERHDRQGFEVHTLGAFLTLKSPSAIGSLIYGAEFYRDKVDSYSRTLNPDGSVKSASIQGPVGDDATYDLIGLFLQDEITVTKRLALVLGGRYELARVDADSVEDPASGSEISVQGDWDALVGNARVLYALDETPSRHVFAGISQGFRAPNLSDLTRFDTARTDEIETPSPALDPEHVVSYELGFKAATAGYAAQLVYFYTDVDDMIVRTPTGRMIDGNQEVTKKNAGDGHVQGVELDARFRFLRVFTLAGVCTWMDGRIDTYPTSEARRVSEYMDRLMPPTGSVALRWDHDGRFWIEGVCTVAAKADKLSTRDASDTSRIPPGGTPGYRVYDIRAGWKHGDALALSVAIENITDEDYRTHGSGINEPGRNVVVAMQTAF